MDGRDLVRLIVAAVLRLGLVSAERHQALQRGLVNSEFDDHSSRRIPAGDVAVLQDVADDLLCICHGRFLSFRHGCLIDGCLNRGQ